MERNEPGLESGREKPKEGFRLTARELEALGYVVEGLENKEISERLNISISLTQKILRKAFCKLQVKRRTDAAVVWSRNREIRGSGKEQGCQK